MESMAHAHPRFLVVSRVAHLSDLQQKTTEQDLCVSVKIGNFEPL